VTFLVFGILEAISLSSSASHLGLLTPILGIRRKASIA
jgi:hypothetical protein